MRTTFLSIIVLFAFQFSDAQYPWNDTTRRSLKDSLAIVKDNSTKCDLLSRIVFDYSVRLPDSCLVYAQQTLAVAMEMKSEVLISEAYVLLGYASFNFGDYTHALAYYQEALKFAESSRYFLSKTFVYENLAELYADEGDFEHSIFYAKGAKSLIESHWKPSFKMQHSTYNLLHDTLFHYLITIEALGEVYEQFNRSDSAYQYYKLLNDGYLESNNGKMDWAVIPYHLGDVYSQKRNYPEAIRYYHTGIAIAADHGINLDLLKNYYGLADAYKNNDVDSSIFYARKVLEVSKYAFNPIFKLKALNILAGIYKSQNKIDSLATYLQLTIAAKDSLFSQQKVMQLQSMTFNKQIQDRELQQKLEQQRLANKNRQNVIILLSGLAILIIVAAGLWRRNVFKQRSYAVLQKQKQEIDFQKKKVEQTLDELKSTQAQLIQSEKMASLGELTAGIAHEIQNPLNFVNNFSEVNNELIGELQDERLKAKSDRNEELQDEIINDLKQNLEKINQHGKRADAIVKGMLQHSRATTGKREQTDINALADEYLRLSYHGMRAKDKSFNVTIETDFDNSIGKINVVPQDIGRVLLNLYNNAFYAVSEKQKTANEKFDPCVSVQTKKLNDKVEITVKDNGSGIPQNVVDKIFQPFFTTKPTGQGTGLGLSLAYDIIKAHGGEIKVETKEGVGSKFMIEIPIKS